MFHRLVADDGPGDELREKADVQQQVEIAALNRHLSPVPVDDIGQNLEGVEADADGQGDLGQVQPDPQQQAQVVRRKVQVFEHKQVRRQQRHGD